TTILRAIQLATDAPAPALEHDHAAVARLAVDADLVEVLAPQRQVHAGEAAQRLHDDRVVEVDVLVVEARHHDPVGLLLGVEPVAGDEHDRDRKSTRLNSSHVKISYAVFCLKKKNT